jgi:putative membrane protein
LFLVCYVLYHFTTPETIFGDANGNGQLEAAEAALVAGVRPYYLLLLLSHIVLAAGSLPFILLTFIKAYTGQFAAHRKMARWVWPVWFYVCVTGPVCYLLLKPYYQ